MRRGFRRNLPPESAFPARAIPAHRPMLVARQTGRSELSFPASAPPRPACSMPNVFNAERTRLRAHLMGLAVACPYDQGNPSDCPLCALRKGPMRERMSWVASLKDDEIARIYQFHLRCLEVKERG